LGRGGQKEGSFHRPLCIQTKWTSIKGMKGAMEAAEFKRKISAIYDIAHELSEAFQISNCTPDGHLLGAIGKIAAKIVFGLTFNSTLQEHNCTWSDGKSILNIQVRCTARGSIAIRKEPQYLIALEISEAGKIYLLYNGPGKHVWEKIQHQKQNQKYATRNQLRDAQNEADPNSKIPIKQNIFDSRLS